MYTYFKLIAEGNDSMNLLLKRMFLFIILSICRNVAIIYRKINLYIATFVTYIIFESIKYMQIYY